MKSVRSVKFNSNILFSKWATPNVYGSGKLYEHIKNESKSQHKRVGPPLPVYDPIRARNMGHILDKRNAPTSLTYQRHFINMSDGGISAVDEITDETAKSKPKPKTPSILMLPGGGRTGYSAVCKIRSKWYLDHGHPRVVVANRRGMSRVPLYSPQINLPYGRYNDTVGIMDYLIDLYPDEKWVIVGSCYGSANGLNYFTQPASDRREIIGGVFDSFQFDGKDFLERQLFSDEKYIRQTTELMMRLFIDLPLCQTANDEVYDQISSLVDRSKFKNIDFSGKEYVRLIYEEIIGPLCSDSPLSTAEEFHMHSMPSYGSEVRNFMEIKKPLVLINSVDDPFSQINEENVESLMDNPNLCLWLFAGGGHIDFIGSMFPYTCYIKEVCLECVDILARRFIENCD